MPATPVMQPRLSRPGRPKPWAVAQAASISPTGKKRMRWFRSRELADFWIRGEEKRLRNYSDGARNLSDEEKTEAAEAIPIARAHGFSLLEAVREKAGRVARQRASVAISEVVAAMVAQLALEKKSDKHIAATRYVGKKFAAAFQDRLVCEVTTEGLQEWFNALAAANKPASVKTIRRYAAMLLRFAQGRGHAAQNPITHLRLRLRDDAAISFLTPGQTRALLDAAGPELRLYVALCAFAGLRPDEAKKLRWEDIGEESIFIRRANSKTRRHRTVPIGENLRAWLTGPGGERVFYSRTQFRRAVEAAGNGAWSQDQLRHGFGSYWLALHGDESKLAQIMGNSPTVIFKHYRVPVSKADAAAYFQIKP